MVVISVVLARLREARVFVLARPVPGFALCTDVLLDARADPTRLVCILSDRVLVSALRPVGRAVPVVVVVCTDTAPGEVGDRRVDWTTDPGVL